MTSKEFCENSDEFRRLCRPRLFWNSRKQGTYRSGFMGLKGKLNIKHAKRERARELKAQEK